MIDTEYVSIEKRLEWFIVFLGIAITAAAMVRYGARGAVGAAAGTALCWLNFRWLRLGAGAVISLGLAQAGKDSAPVPRMLHARFILRLLLLLIFAYAILIWLKLPIVPVICGLSAVVPAILLELGYELVRGQHRWTGQ
ncbi:MAG TPA: ATP synthase subunit I [Candidatus Acidoferrales bacterium]|nr:ATP synthase subunit I [Candidatus Acidoferrales bacterium]